MRLVRRDVQPHLKAHRLIERRLARVVIIERRNVRCLGGNQALLRVHNVKIRADARAVTDLRDLIILLRLIDSDLRRVNIFLCRQEIEIRCLHFELDLFLERQIVLLCLVKRFFFLLYLRFRHVIIKNIPARDDPDGHRIALGMVCPESLIAGKNALRLRHNPGTVPRLRRLHRRLRRFDGAISGDTVGAMFQRVHRTIGEAQIVLRVRQFVAGVNDRIRRQTDDIVKRGDGNVVIVLRVDERLLLIRQFDLRAQDVGFRHHADAVLRLDVIEVRRQRIDGFLIDLNHITALQYPIIGGSRPRLDGLPRRFQCQIRRVDSVLRRLDAVFQLTAGVKRKLQCQAVVKVAVVFYTGDRLRPPRFGRSLSPQRRRRSLPGQSRAAVPARLVPRPDSLLNVAFGDLD